MGRPYLITYRICAGIIGLIAWLGLSLQFYTAIPNILSQGRTLPGAIVQVISFFTIQANLLVAIALTSNAVLPARKDFFFKRAGVITALVVYISIVSLVYNLVLRQLWHPIGLAKLGDELVHSIVPVLFIVYWLTAILKAGINYKQGFTWLWYPFFYLLYVLIRGAICGIYPYFFLDISKFGAAKVSLNVFILMLVFLGMSMFYVFIARLMSRNVTG